MRVGQSREATSRQVEQRLPVVVSDFAFRCVVLAVDPLRGLFVQMTEHHGEVFGVAGRFGDEVIVIGEHRPGFESPAEVGADFEQPALQNIQPFSRAKMMLFPPSRCRDEVGPAFRQPVRRRMRPGDRR